MKPGNVLVAATDAGEHAYLCDFGLAKHISSVTSLTGDRNLVGTIAYISPEQIEGGTIDGRADVYSLGCMLFECLTGEAPFTRDSELAAVYAHMHEPPPRASEVRPGLPAAFDAVVATAMAKAPDDRFASCGALAAAAAALRGEAPPRRRAGPPPRPLGAGGRGGRGAAAVAVGGVLVLRGGGEPAQARLEIPPKSLGLIDARSHEVVGGIPFASQPWDVAFDAREAWVLLGDERRVARVDIASRKILSTTTLPFTPGGIATGGGDAWVTEDGGDGLVRARRNDRRDRAAVLHPGEGDRSRSPTGVAFGAGSVWVARASETVRVDPRTGAVQHRFATPLSTTSVVFSGDDVWAAGTENGRIVRIDPAANRITAVTPLHGTVTDLAVGPELRVGRDRPRRRGLPAEPRRRQRARDGPGRRRAVDPVGRGRRVDRRRRGPRDRPGEPGGTRERLPTDRHAVGGPLPRRPAVGVGRRVRARRIRREGGTLRIPIVSDDIGQADPAVIRGPVYSQLGLLDLRVPPELPGRRGGRRPGAPAGGRGRDAHRLGGRPDIPFPRAPGVPLLAALG